MAVNTTSSASIGSGIVSATITAIEKATRGLHSIGTVALMLMMFLTAFDVIGRKFGHPILGTFDITGYLMAIVVAFSLAYCDLKKGHVNVDVAVNLLPQRARNILVIFTTLGGVVIFVLIAWQTALQTINQFQEGVTSTVLPIPVYPFVGVVCVGCFMLALMLIVDLIQYSLKAVGKWTQ